MTFWDLANGVATAHPRHPRSELREVEPDGADENWPASGTPTLTAIASVTRVPDRVCIVQIHVGRPLKAGVAASTKPLVEVLFTKTGEVVLGIEESPMGAPIKHRVAHVSLGTKIHFSLQLAGQGGIAFTVEGAATTFSVPASFAPYGQYFKAGNYDQTASSDPKVGAIVKFYALTVQHAP